MNFSKYLLPWYWKIVGFILLIASIVLAFDRFYLGHKYHFLKWRVFSFYSEFLFTRRFAFTRNNQGEELIALLAILSLVFIAVSKEKQENEVVHSFRVKALVIAFVVNTLLTILGTLFLHGLGYFYFLSILLVIPIALYCLLFQFIYHRNKRFLKV